MIIIYRGGGRNSKIVKNIICKASDFDFLNKTKNEHRCSTILGYEVKHAS
jgi:hypothetical protein